MEELSENTEIKVEEPCLSTSTNVQEEQSNVQNESEVKTSVVQPEKPEKKYSKYWYPTPARAAQFEAANERKRLLAIERSVKREREKQDRLTLLEIERMKGELKRKEIYEEADRLRSMIQTAAPISITTNPYTVAPVQTQVNIPETKMSNTTPIQIEEKSINEVVPTNAVSVDTYVPRDDGKRKAQNLEYHEEEEEDDYPVSRSTPVLHHSTPPIAIRPHHHQRHEDTHRVYTREHRSNAVVDYEDDDMEYAEILAEAKRVVAERRRISAAERMREVHELRQEVMPPRIERAKLHRPSEASRYLEHTQQHTNQQFTQKIPQKSTNEEFIWI